MFVLVVTFPPSLYIQRHNVIILSKLGMKKCTRDEAVDCVYPSTSSSRPDYSAYGELKKKSLPCISLSNRLQAK